MSRGSTAGKLIHDKIWLAGPIFLEDDYETLSNQVQVPAIQEEETESVKVKPVYRICINEDIISQLLGKYSSLYWLKRAVSWLRKYISGLGKEQVEKFNFS